MRKLPSTLPAQVSNGAACLDTRLHLPVQVFRELGADICKKKGHH